MNLDKFKEEADLEIVSQKEIAELKNKAIIKFEEFFAYCSKSAPLWNEKMKKSVDAFISDFVRCMEDNGFTLDCCCPKITENNYPSIKAQYKDKFISLEALNYDGEKIDLMTDQDCKAEFWFDLPADAPRYRYWADNITVSGRNIHDFGEKANLSYKAFVDSFNTKDELQKVIEKIQVNIEHFKKSIEDIDEYEFVIIKFGDEKVYNKFQDFFESIDN